MNPANPSLALQYPIIDGFLYNTQLRCNLTFLSLALAEYEALRRSGAYRSKSWLVPQDANAIPIPARNSYEYQVEVIPGSAIWGYTFTGVNVLDDDDPTLNGVFSFQVTDSCNDVKLFSEFVTKPTGAPTYRQQLLSRLHICAEPGLLHVEIASTFGADQTGAQLILYGGEPTCR